ncbi:MAG: hypothetical protein ACI4LX_01015 [Treponema sp.]
MKKFFSGLLAVFFLAGAVFAEKNYSADVQILNGFSIDDYQIKKEDAFNADSLLFDLNVETWHFFKINGVLDVGFMAGITAGIGGTAFMKNGSVSVQQDALGVACHINAVTGPAIALSVKDIVRFNIAVALDVSFLNLVSNTENGEAFYTYCAPLGFALEVQAKFTPDRKVSPVIAYRLSTNFGNEFGTLSNGTGRSFTAESLVVVTNTVFVGIAFNW